MNDILHFLGSYWWLAFPLAGIGAGVFRRFEHLSSQRHKQRLEVIKATGEMKAVRMEAGVEPPAITRPSPLPDQLTKIFATHDAVTARWLDYELDVAKLIAFPTMSDGRQDLTAAFLRAKKVADSLRPASADARTTPDQVAEYRSAVTEYEVAFDLAERDARRVRDSQFTALERKRLATAQQLLAVAVDQSATPAERQLAYRRVRDEVEGLLSLSDEAVDILQKKVALQIEAAPVAPEDRS